MSTDTEMVHKAFLDQPSLGFIPSFPLGMLRLVRLLMSPTDIFVVSDTTRSVSRHFGMINSETGLAQRSAFIIDSTRQVRFSFVVEDERLSHSIDTICNIVSLCLSDLLKITSNILFLHSFEPFKPINHQVNNIHNSFTRTP